MSTSLSTSNMRNSQTSGIRTITIGASSGLGWALSIELVRQGHYVLASSRRYERLLGLMTRAQLVGDRDKLRVMQVDVRSIDSLVGLLSEARKQWGGIDALIYCAGFYAPTQPTCKEVSYWNDHFEINLFGLIRVITAIRETIDSRPVHIVCFTSSLTQNRIDELSFPYSLAKGSLDLFVNMSDSFLQKQGIHLHLIDPGPFVSEMNSDGTNRPETVAKAVIAQLGLG